MTAAALGEFGRIARYFAPLAGPGGLALKDDAALVECRPGYRLVVTVDQAVEGVHFLTGDPPDLVAKKLLRRNLSDLAAMGATPLHYLLTTALPQSCGDDWVRRFAAGLAQDQQHYGVRLIGGDSTSTVGPVALTLTAIGEVPGGAEIRRSGARPGDDVWVSGTIGDASLGLKILRSGGDGLTTLASAHREALMGRFRLPEPRTELGPRLAGIAHAMIDVSDGLVADLGHLCENSGCAATIDLPALPLSAAAAAFVGANWAAWLDLATSGDDYELLFAAPSEARTVIKAIAGELAMRVTAIGVMTAGQGVRLRGEDGRDVPVTRAGWRHF